MFIIVDASKYRDLVVQINDNYPSISKHRRFEVY